MAVNSPSRSAGGAQPSCQSTASARELVVRQVPEGYARNNEAFAAPSPGELRHGELRRPEPSGQRPHYAAQLAHDGGRRCSGVYLGADGAVLDALDDVTAEQVAEHRVVLGKDATKAGRYGGGYPSPSRGCRPTAPSADGDPQATARQDPATQACTAIILASCRERCRWPVRQAPRDAVCCEPWAWRATRGRDLAGRARSAPQRRGRWAAGPSESQHGGLVWGSSGSAMPSTAYNSR
jgi:hypothetical protein